MRNRKSPWVFVILLLVGALIGGYLGQFASRYDYFSWMSFGGNNGYRELFAFSFDPLLDTHILRFGMNLAFRINFGSILGMLLGTIAFMRMNRS